MRKVRAGFCPCGKVYSASEREARRRWELEEAWHEKKNPYVRFYNDCGYGSWHWTRKMRPKNAFKCSTCEEHAYRGVGEVFKAIDDMPTTKRVKWVPFHCGNFWHLELVSTRELWMTYDCQCGRTGYYLEQHKQSLLSSARSFEIGNFDLVSCAYGHTHVTMTKGKK